MKRTRVGVLMGGPSAEREVSLSTGQAVVAALEERGHEVTPLDWHQDQDLGRLLREAGVDAVWLALHGTYGEDGCVQGLCEILQLPYTGSGVLASALAMDKVVAKRVLAAAGLPVPRWRLLTDGGEASPWGFPVVVKPSREGSSVGITIVAHEEQLGAAVAAAAACRGEVLVEEYVAGRELSVGILDDAAVGTVEIRPQAEFYSYEAKYERHDTAYLVPAPVSPDITATALELGERAHHALGCCGHSRVDFLLSERDELYLLEVNTLPGMTSKSLLPKVAAEAGITYPELCERILASAGLKA